MSTRAICLHNLLTVNLLGRRALSYSHDHKRAKIPNLRISQDVNDAEHPLDHTKSRVVPDGIRVCIVEIELSRADQEVLQLTINNCALSLTTPVESYHSCNSSRNTLSTKSTGDRHQFRR
jgi:hypothetical protein